MSQTNPPVGTAIAPPPITGSPLRPEQPGDYHPHVNFWQTRMAQDVVPFATSVILHSMIIILAMILVPKIAKNLNPDRHVEETLVPDVSLATDDNIGGVLHPGIGGDPTRNAAQENDPSQKVSQGLSQHKTSNVDPYDTAGGDSGNMIQRGAGNGPGRGNGAGNDPFGGNGGEAAFGPRGGGGGHGPPSKIVGTGGNVKSVVFVCDATGSMLEKGKIDILKAELKHEISRMRAIQSFDIIFFQETDDKAGYRAFRQKLVPANPGNQTAVEGFLEEVNAHGPTVPIAALDEAYKESPQLVYFLTDGEFDNPEGPNDQQMLAYFQSKAAGRKVHVNTVLFLRDHKDTEDKAVSPTLERIARENGGVFKMVYADDF